MARSKGVDLCRRYLQAPVSPQSSAVSAVFVEIGGGGDVYTRIFSLIFISSGENVAVQIKEPQAFKHVHRSGDKSAVANTITHTNSTLHSLKKCAFANQMCLIKTPDNSLNFN